MEPSPGQYSLWRNFLIYLQGELEASFHHGQSWNKFRFRWPHSVVPNCGLQSYSGSWADFGRFLNGQDSVLSAALVAAWNSTQLFGTPWTSLCCVFVAQVGTRPIRPKTAKQRLGQQQEWQPAVNPGPCTNCNMWVMIDYCPQHWGTMLKHFWKHWLSSFYGALF